jgi:nucleotide-binding universal stress UspA family protein
MGGIGACETKKLPLAETMARALGSELILLHVLPESEAAADVVSPQEARACAYLEMIAARLHADGLHVHGVVRSARSPADAIVAEARAQNADLIILGFDVRRGLPRAFRRNVADEVTRRADCPVVLVRPESNLRPAPEIRSFDEDAAFWGPLSRWSLGVRSVPIARIIGSVGRAGEPNNAYDPRSAGGLKGERRVRYQSVLAAMKAGAALPAVQLYKLGGAYYIFDGNHRIAAAQSLGQLEIDADVTEFVPIDDSVAQRVFAERRVFERETGLLDVESAHLPGTYWTLQQLVGEFVSQCGLPPHADPFRRWHNQVYLPLAKLIRARDLTHRFPGERASDVIARIAHFRAEESRREGRAIDLMVAADLFLEDRSPATASKRAS